MEECEDCFQNMIVKKCTWKSVKIVFKTMIVKKSTRTSMKNVMKIMEKMIMKVIMTMKIMVMDARRMMIDVRMMIAKNATRSVRTARKFTTKNVSKALMR